MVHRIWSADAFGLWGRSIEVEVTLAPGRPSFTIVGLAGKSVCESRDRVRSAIIQSGYAFPERRVLVNLAPAYEKKDSAPLDLPIAVAILAASGQARLESGSLAAVGELALSGRLRPVQGALLLSSALRSRGVKQLILPPANAEEAALCPDIEIIPAVSLNETIAALEGRNPPPEVPKASSQGPAFVLGDFREVLGQETAKRALLIAAAGGHHSLLVGPPGVGKTMLGHRFPGILPGLDPEASLEVTRIWSAAGLLKRGAIKRPPFRAPHHTTSHVGLVGGGSELKPGEATLAHRGSLFLDEFPEFVRPALEALREILERKSITVSRAKGSVTLPADFLLIASMNPCPCGYAGHPSMACRCSPAELRRYQARLSGPIVDRIDLFVSLDVPTPHALSATQTGLDTEIMAARTLQARRRQKERFPSGELNGTAPEALFSKQSPLPPKLNSWLQGAVTDLALSGRAYWRTRRVGRTIADLEGEEHVRREHLAEALAWRPPATFQAGFQ